MSEQAFTNEEHAAIDAFEQHNRNRWVAAMAVRRVDQRKAQAKALASAYPIPEFKDAKITPGNLWQDFTDPRSPAMYERIAEIEKNNPSEAPPHKWVWLLPQTKANLGGLCRLVVDSFQPVAQQKDTARRRKRILNTLEVAIRAPASTPERGVAAGRIWVSVRGSSC